MALSWWRSSSSSSSSSSSTPKFKYDVFLSFRGDDTRNNFTSHLLKALCEKKIATFIDYKLKRGDEISPSLLKAIEESRISVVIFSKDYASSRWCLEELVKILECNEKSNQIVMPVFYGVEPTHIRHQTEGFAVAFAGHEQRFKESLDKVQAWKDVLRRAANFSGWNSDTIKPESALIEKIVEDILKRLNDMYPSCHDENLLGIYSRIKQVESLLGSTGDVGRVGIWGIGGIGKTTLAQAVYDRISCQFEGSCFVERIRGTLEQSGELGLNYLRQRLVSALLGEEIACIGAFTSTRLGRKKLLIVFDDVTDIRQVESLTGGLGFPGSGSRIIVTSRDKQVLRNICGEDQIYKVEDLCFNDALKLFCRYAFHQNNPEVDFKELSNGVVEKVGGVPLALKVLGSSLFHEGKEVWKSAMQKLENNFDRVIHEVLKISYDGLDDHDQNMFLYITCFFIRWNVNLVKAAMDDIGFFTERGISALINKSLITISDNHTFHMHDLVQAMGKEIVRQESINNPGKRSHDLVQAMGKEIVRQESINNPGKRSRLWHHNGIYNILTSDTLKIVIKVQVRCKNIRPSKAMKIAAMAEGLIISLAWEGERHENLVVVVGDGFTVATLTKELEKKLGAELLLVEAV